MSSATGLQLIMVFGLWVATTCRYVVVTNLVAH